MESVPVYCKICKEKHVPDGRHETAHESCCADTCAVENNGCGCSHGESDLGEGKTWLPILLGGLAMGLGLALRGAEAWLGTACFLLAYVLLGLPVLKQAWEDIRVGRVFGESFLMGIATLGAFAIGEYVEGVAVMLFYRVGEYFQEKAVDSSRRSIKDVVSLRPETARLLREGEWVNVDPAEVAVGQQILVKPGERIPLDGVIVSGDSRINNSALTGESMPESAKPGKEVMAGGVNESSPIIIEAIRPLAESASSRILRAVEDASKGKPRLENFITRFSKVYTPIVVLLAVLLAAIPPLMGLGAFSIWLYRALMFLVISCPCALVLSVPLTFFAGLANASQQGVLFKGANRMEALAGVKAVIFDKTGTLTHGVFKVQEVHPTEGFTGEKLVALAASAEMHSPHPVAKAILDAAPGEVTQPEQTEEIPGKGVSALVGGQRVLVGNAMLLAEAGISIDKEREGTVAYVAVQGAYAGCIRIADEIKADAAKAVRLLNEQVGFTAIFSGDAKSTTLTVAKEVGVRECRFGLLPEGKLSGLQEIRNRLGSVVFVGDGINDAPVLMGADVGIAIGGTGTDMAVEAADVVLLSRELTVVPEAVRVSRRTVAIARQNIVFAIVVKVLVMSLGALGFANMWMAIFADVGMSLLCVLNALRLLPRAPSGAKPPAAYAATPLRRG